MPLNRLLLQCKTLLHFAIKSSQADCKPIFILSYNIQLKIIPSSGSWREPGALLGRRKLRGDAAWLLAAVGAAPCASCFMEPVQADKEQGNSEERSGKSVAAQPLWWRRLTLLKGTKLLCVSINPQLPPPAASLVRAFSGINSAFPEQGGWSLNPLYPWGETEHQSPLPLAAAGAQGPGRAVTPQIGALAVAVNLIKVVLCSELGCAGWGLWSSSLQCPWPSEQQRRTLLSLGPH